MMTHVQVSWTKFLVQVSRNKFLVRETWIVCQGPNNQVDTVLAGLRDDIYESS